MHKYQRYGLGIAGLCAWGLLFIVSLFANFDFSQSLGSSPFERAVLGAAAIASDIFKAIAPVAFLWLAFTAKQAWPSFSVAVIGSIAALFSLLAAIGFVSGQRMGSYDSAVFDQSRADMLRKQAARTERKANWVPKARPVFVVEAEIQAAKLHRHFRISRECTRPGRISGAHCEKYRGLLVELGSAKAAAQLDNKLTGQENALLSNGAPKRDYMAEVLASWLGVDQKTVVLFSIAIAVALIEAGAGLGLAIGLTLLTPPDSTLGKALRRVTPTKKGDKGNPPASSIGPYTSERAPQIADPGGAPVVARRTVKRPPAKLEGGKRLKLVTGAS